MARRLALFFLGVPFCLGLTAAPAAQGAGDDKAAVRAVVENYLDGLRHNNVESLKKAFWPEAKLFFTKGDGTLGQLTQAEWYASFASSAGQDAKADFKIASLEVTSDAASVKVVETYPRSRYTDYLSLLRISGKWMIVNKIYTAEKLAGK